MYSKADRSQWRSLLQSLPRSTRHLLGSTKAYIPRDKKFFGAVPTKYEPPPSPFRGIWSDVHFRIQSLLEAKKRTSLGVKSEYGGRCNASKFRINLESLSRFDGLCVVMMQTHARRQQKFAFFLIASSRWFRSISLYLSLFTNVILSQAGSYFEFYPICRF